MVIVVMTIAMVVTVVMIVVVAMSPAVARRGAPGPGGVPSRGPPAMLDEDVVLPALGRDVADLVADDDVGSVVVEVDLVTLVVVGLIVLDDRRIHGRARGGWLIVDSAAGDGDCHDEDRSQDEACLHGILLRSRA